MRRRARPAAEAAGAVGMPPARLVEHPGLQEWDQRREGVPARRRLS